MPSLFKDLGKTSADILKKGFPAGDAFAWRWQLNNMSSGGVKLSSQAQRNLDGSMSAKLTENWEFSNGVKTDVELATSDKLKVTLKKNDVLTPGLTTTYETQTTVSDPTKSTSVKVAVDYAHEKARLTTDLTYDIFASKPAELLSSISFARGHFTVGGEVDYRIGGKGAPNFAIGASHKNESSEIFSYLRSKKSGASQTVGISYSRSYEGKHVSVTDVSVDVKTQEKSANIGLKYVVSSDLTLTGKVGLNGVAALSAKTSVNKWTTLTIGSEIDTANLSGGDHKVHFDLAMG